MAKVSRGVAFPQELFDDAVLVARVRGVSFNALVAGALAAEVERAKADGRFLDEVRAALARDQEIFERMSGE
jgi:hypothetical protein